MHWYFIVTSLINAWIYTDQHWAYSGYKGSYNPSAVSQMIWRLCTVWNVEKQMLMKFPIDVLLFKYNQKERVEYTCIYRKPHSLHYLKQENKTIVFCIWTQCSLGNHYFELLDVKLTVMKQMWRKQWFIIRRASLTHKGTRLKKRKQLWEYSLTLVSGTLQRLSHILLNTKTENSHCHSTCQFTFL